MPSNLSTIALLCSLWSFFALSSSTSIFAITKFEPFGDHQSIVYLDSASGNARVLANLPRQSRLGYGVLSAVDFKKSSIYTSTDLPARRATILSFSGTVLASAALGIYDSLAWVRDENDGTLYVVVKTGTSISMGLFDFAGGNYKTISNLTGADQLAPPSATYHAPSKTFYMQSRASASSVVLNIINVESGARQVRPLSWMINCMAVDPTQPTTLYVSASVPINKTSSETQFVSIDVSGPTNRVIKFKSFAGMMSSVCAFDPVQRLFYADILGYTEKLDLVHRLASVNVDNGAFSQVALKKQALMTIAVPPV